MRPIWTVVTFFPVLVTFPAAPSLRMPSDSTAGRPSPTPAEATLAQKSHLAFTAGVLCEHCHVRPLMGLAEGGVRYQPVLDLLTDESTGVAYMVKS